ncbi:hypothetical protein IHE61_06815 [Streptomyces sp. GKU 257-1]|nr:hypothetical protein [Streptomyces sp. GKU 257-1]
MDDTLVQPRQGDTDAPPPAPHSAPPPAPHSAADDPGIPAPQQPADAPVVPDPAARRRRRPRDAAAVAARFRRAGPGGSRGRRPAAAR